ncbi:MAG TPA: GerAB/ArcD/ProY family transporter [Candidatus Pullichristensenella avicola]|nr:GerAB/ArcD/ProY family transporter [Candidatus Pullichristensenella avicola]
MKLTLPLSSVRALAIVAVSSRFLMGIFLDMPWLYNAAWLSALGATLLCAPLGLLIDRFARANDARSALEALEAHSGRLLTRCVSMLFCLICAYETAVTARVLSNTVRHVALSESSALSLLLPLLLAAMLAACLNGQAVGSAARVWLKFVPVLLLIVVLIQAKSYRLQWLFPLLGPGLETLADGAVGGAGWLSLFALLWLCAQRDEGAPSRSGALLPMLATGAACALLLALLATMTPPSVRTDLTRTYQLDKLLSNGRASLVSQLPLILLWYNGLIFGTTTGVFLSAKFLQTALPRLDGRLAVLLCGSMAFAAAMLALAEQSAAVAASRWLFVAVATPTLVLLLPPLWKGGKTACAPAK